MSENCIDMCLDTCVDVWIDMRGVSAGSSRGDDASVYPVMRLAVSALSAMDMRMDMCVGIGVRMCTDMCVCRNYIAARRCDKTDKTRTRNHAVQSRSYVATPYIAVIV